MATETKISKTKLETLKHWKGMYFTNNAIAITTLNKLLRLGLVEVGLVQGDDIYYVLTERAYEQIGMDDKYQWVSSSYNMMIMTHQRLHGIEDSPESARLYALEKHYRKLAGLE